jgi:hypothetical protein
MRFTFLFVFIFSINSLFAQIIFTDVEPDVTVAEFNNGYAIDFNNDAKVDLHITLLSNTGTWVMRIIPDNAEDTNFVINVGDDNGGAKIINYGELINSSSNWYEIGSNWGDLLFGHWDSNGDYGYWTGTQEDKYLGIKFKIATNYYYGWVHLTTHVYANDNMDFTIKGFAYNSVAGESIFAGDEGSGIDVSEIENSNFKVYPNPTKGILYLEGLEKISNVNLYDILGNKVEIKISKDKIYLSKLSSGVYFLNYTNGDVKMIKKIIKQ